MALLNPQDEQLLASLKRRGLSGRGTRHKPMEMNRLEAAYAERLDLQKAHGSVLFWKFESIKLRLADATFYTPDFMVMTLTYAIELHEIKAFWKSTGGAHWEDDARVKIKVAASIYPFVFKSFSRDKDGDWKEEVF